MNNKRSRSANWDEEEKQLFRSVLKEYTHILENKSIDTHTNNIKSKAWEEISKKFNELNVRHRELSQLKIQWKMMKVNARKTNSICHEANQTGDGARPATPDDAIIEIINSVNPAELLRDNLYDSDEVVSKDKEVTYTPKQKNVSTNAAKVPKRKVTSNISENDLTYRKDHNDYVRSMISHSKMLKEEEHRRQIEMAEEEHTIKIAIQREKLKCATLEREILELKKVREEKNLFNNES